MSSASAARPPPVLKVRVYSRYELINRTRGYEYHSYERTIDSHIRNLRHKIDPDPHAPALIQTVTGAGYGSPSPATRKRDNRLAAPAGSPQRLAASAAQRRSAQWRPGQDI